jgi:low temperature requirement protein LtrA
VPFNLAAALLVITAGIVEGDGEVGGGAAYWLWAAALAVQVLSPFVLPVRGRFAIQPSHFTERHGALVIIVLGESVVDIGIGAEGHPVTVSLAAYFYAYIPMLLGIVALASGVKQAIVRTGARCRPGPAWRWAAVSPCSWPAARRSGTRCGSALDATG